MDTSGISSISSPSTLSRAISVLTLIFSVPSLTSIFSTLPSSGDSSSIVALSVSISAKISPETTLSPSLTNHFTKLPVSIVGDKAGRSIFINIPRCIILLNLEVATQVKIFLHL